MSNFLSFIPFHVPCPFTHRKPMNSAIILTLPTELILEIGEMLDIMSLINLAKAHPLFTIVLDDYDTSLIKSKSKRCLRSRPISPKAIPPNEAQAYREHYVAPTRFGRLDSVLGSKDLCAHEINLLNYLVAAGVARGFHDAVSKFAAAIKSVTRYASIRRRYKVEPWFASGLAGERFGTAGVFEQVETGLHRQHTEKAVNRIAAVYSHVAEIVKMVDYVAKKSLPDTGAADKPIRLPRFQPSCCGGIRTWDQLIKEVKSDPDYKEPVIQSESEDYA